MIETGSSAAAFEALGHEARLGILRRLIPAGPQGVHAGAIAEALALPPSRLSFHLNRLTAAGLIECRRDGRHLYYAACYARLGELIRFLVEDCCSGAPEGCLPDCPRPPASAAGGCMPSCAPDRRAPEKGGQR